MTFNGKELHSMGVPQNKIKFLIGKDFSSVEELLASITDKPKEKTGIPDDSVFSWVKRTFPHLPMVMKGNLPIPMSNSELRRIIDSGGLEINGKKVNSIESISQIEFPISSIVWFPKSKGRITW